jgi:hypothetical protein
VVSRGGLRQSFGRFFRGLAILVSVIGTAINHYDATHQPPAITPAEMQDMIHEAAREAAASQPAPSAPRVAVPRDH